MTARASRGASRRHIDASGYIRPCGAWRVTGAGPSAPPTTPVSTAKAQHHPFYRELVEPGACLMHYHEGSFYPIGTVLAYARRWQDFVARVVSHGACQLWLPPRARTPCGTTPPPSSEPGSANSTLGASVHLDEILFTPSSPEEAFLPAFAANEGGLAPHRVAAQLCWRPRSTWPFRDGRGTDRDLLMLGARSG